MTGFEGEDQAALRPAQTEDYRIVVERIPVYADIQKQLSMNLDRIAFTLSLLDMVCWGVCFWWMHRISKNQNSLLDQLREQGKRIEQFSKVEHDLIKEVHPQVGEIREGMEKIVAVVNETPPKH